MSRLKVTLKHSTISCPPRIRASVKCLGLRKLESSVIVKNEPAIRGLIKKVLHLVEVQEVK